MTSFRQLIFSPVLVLIRSLRPIIGMSISDEAIKCVQSQNKPCKLRKAGSQFDRAVVGWVLAKHRWSFSTTSESSTASGCSPLRMGVDFQDRCAALHAFSLTSLWGSYCCRRVSCLFWTNLIQSIWLRRERDIHSQVKNLSFLKMTPCLNTGE